MVEGDVDFRGNLEIQGSEDGPEAETCGEPTITTVGDEHFSDSTAGGQEMEGD